MSPKRGLALGAVALLAGFVACRSATDSGPARDVRGQWSYSAVQSAPFTATLAGTLTISQQNGHAFQGSLAVVQQDGQGTVTQLAGIVTGQVLDSVSVVFTAYLDATGRQHLATMTADSVRGTWVEQAASQITSSGSFVATLAVAP